MLDREITDFYSENHVKLVKHWVAKVQDWYLLMDEGTLFERGQHENQTILASIFLLL
jgi:ABC-type antimicrobial peptide transport system ATPase subunit